MHGKKFVTRAHVDERNTVLCIRILKW